MLNYVLPGFVLSIGGLNFTYCLDRSNGLTIRRPIAEASSPYGWQCNFTLAIPGNQALMPISIIKSSNPGFWSIGQTVRLFFFDRLFATLYISRYSYSEQDRTGQCECVDSVSFFNYKTPAKDYKGLGFPACSSTSVNALANKVFNELGISGSVNIGGAINVPPNKPTGSWIAFLQSYLGERGAWLYSTPSGVVSSALYPVNTRSPNMYRSLMDVDRYQPVSTGDTPHTKILANCSVEKFAKCAKEKDPEPTEEYQLVDGKTGGKVKVLAARTTITRQSIENKVEIKTVIEQSLAVIDSSIYKGSKSEIVSQVIKETQIYDTQGRLIEVITLTNKCLCLALPEQFPGTLKLVEAEKIIEKFSETNPYEITINKTPDGVMRSHTKTVYARFAKGTTTLKKKGLGSPKDAFPSLNHYLDVKEKIIEAWGTANQSLPSLDGGSVNSQENCKCNEYDYTKKTYRQENFSVSARLENYLEDKPYWKVSGLQLQATESPTEENSIPPEFKTKKPNCPTCTVSFNTEVNFSFPGSSIYQKPNEVSASTLQTVQELQYFAQLVGTLEHQRYESRTVSMPLPIEYMTNPVPFMIAAIHDGLFIIDSPSIVLGEDGAEFTFVANRCGNISAIQPHPPAPIIYLPIALDNTSTPPLNIYPIQDTTARFGVYFPPIDVTIYGGIIPYAVNLNSLPNGLNYQNGQISGIPDQVGAFDVQATATDATGSMAVINFQITILENFVDLDPVSQAIIPITGKLNIEFFKPPTVDEPIYEIIGDLKTLLYLSLPLTFELALRAFIGFPQAPSRITGIGHFYLDAPMYQAYPDTIKFSILIEFNVIQTTINIIMPALAAFMTATNIDVGTYKSTSGAGFVVTEISVTTINHGLGLRPIIQEV